MDAGYCNGEALGLWGETMRRRKIISSLLVSKQASEQAGLQTRACWVQLLGSKTLRQCSLFEVSNQGATIEGHGVLPDTFDVFFALDANAGRRCRVVARSGQKVDVEFVDAAQG
jgi:hypothetical protein